MPHPVKLALVLMLAGSPARGCEVYRYLARGGARLLRVLFPDPQAPISDRKWREKQAHWQKEMDEGVRRFLGSYRHPTVEPAFRESDMTFLKEKFGFRFGKKLPDREEFLRLYDALMDEYVKAGIVKPEEVLRPGAAYEVLRGEDKGQIKLAPSSERPRNGWGELSPSPSPRLYTRLLRQGFHPLDDTVFHDLGHFIGYARYPRYMAAMRRFAERPPTGPGELSQDAWTLRYLYLLEGFSLMPESSRPELATALAPAFAVKGGPGIKVSEIERHYATVSERDRQAQADKLVGLYLKHAEKYGGSAMELGALGDYHERAEMRQTLYGLCSNVYKGNISPQALAMLEVALWESSFIPPETFLTDFSKASLPPTSPVYRFFVESGISEDVPYYDRDGNLVHERGLIARSLTGDLTDAELKQKAFFLDYSNLGRDQQGKLRK